MVGMVQVLVLLYLCAYTTHIYIYFKDNTWYIK